MRIIAPRFIAALTLASAVTFLVATGIPVLFPRVPAGPLAGLWFAVAVVAIVWLASTWPGHDWLRAIVINVSAGLLLGIVTAFGALFALGAARGIPPASPAKLGMYLRTAAILMPVVVAAAAIPLGLIARRVTREQRARALRGAAGHRAPAV